MTRWEPVAFRDPCFTLASSVCFGTFVIEIAVDTSRDDQSKESFVRLCIYVDPSCLILRIDEENHKQEIDTSSNPS